jgi:hypothetical protein
MNDRRGSNLFLCGLVLAGLLAAAPPASAAVRVYVHVAPPAPPVEVVGVAPGPGHVWIAGFHRWDGRAYVWVPGHWVARPRPRAHWVPGRWAKHRRGYYWIEGRWS